MKVFITSASLVLMLVAAACSSDDDGALTAADTAPDIEATVQAGVQATVSALPRATSVPETLSSETLLETATETNAISADWDALRTEIDQWRSSLIACDASSVHGALSDFAGTITALADQSRGLPAGSSANELADLVIQAIETEAIAFRSLRDAWTADDNAPYEAVETARALSADLRRQSNNRQIELATASSSASRSEVEVFTGAELTLAGNWDLFIDSYEDFRLREPQLFPADIVTELGLLVTQSAVILGQIRALPTTEEARPVVQLLAVAAEDTDLALRLLRDAVRPDAFGLTPVTTAFVDFEAVLVTSSGLRLQASQTLADVVEQASADTAASVKSLDDAFAPIATAWDAFHAEFDTWRATEGGCDRASAVAQLGDFADSYGALTARVRDLTRALILREPSDLLLEAVEREESAMVELRDGWQPFGVSTYERYDQERTGASKLRRSVQATLQDLLIESGVAPEDLPG